MMGLWVVLSWRLMAYYKAGAAQQAGQAHRIYEVALREGLLLKQQGWGHMHISGHQALWLLERNSRGLGVRAGVTEEPGKLWELGCTAVRGTPQSQE